LFAVLLHLLLREHVSTSERIGCVVAICLIVTLVVLGTSAYGMTMGLGASFVNALYYVAAKRLRTIIPFFYLMCLMYSVAAAVCMVVTFALEETSLNMWLQLFTSRYLFLTFLSCLASVMNTGCFTAALKYVSPVFVTAIGSLDPIVTLLADIVMHNPTPGLRMLCLLGILMITAICIALGGMGPKEKKIEIDITRLRQVESILDAPGAFENAKSSTTYGSFLNKIYDVIAAVHGTVQFVQRSPIISPSSVVIGAASSAVLLHQSYEYSRPSALVPISPLSLSLETGTHFE
jgi:hypothetical protein